jgi:hypothetical protein
MRNSCPSPLADGEIRLGLPVNQKRLSWDEKSALDAFAVYNQLT